MADPADCSYPRNSKPSKPKHTLTVLCPDVDVRERPDFSLDVWPDLALLAHDLLRSPMCVGDRNMVRLATASSSTALEHWSTRAGLGRPGGVVHSRGHDDGLLTAVTRRP